MSLVNAVLLFRVERRGAEAYPQPSLKGREGIYNDHPTPNGIRENKQGERLEDAAL